MDCNPPSSSVHEIFQARILEWVVISFSRGFFWPRDQTCISVSCIAGRFFTHWVIRETPEHTDIVLWMEVPSLRVPLCGLGHCVIIFSGVCVCVCVSLKDSFLERDMCKSLFDRWLGVYDMDKWWEVSRKREQDVQRHGVTNTVHRFRNYLKFYVPAT